MCLTGNADGGIRQVEFGGVDATVMAGSNSTNNLLGSNA